MRLQIHTIDGNLLHPRRVWADTPFHHQQKLLALPSHTDHMSLNDAIKGTEGGREVEHGGQLDKDVAGMGTKLLLQHTHIGCAVLNACHLPACCITTCRIYI